MKQKFILNQIISLEENKLYEFKEITGANPPNTIKNTVDEYVIAFLNVFKGKGGSIYWGVDNNRKVTGVKLNYNQRDKVKRLIDNQIEKIKPSITSLDYEIILHEIFGENSIVIEDLYIVEVSVLPPFNSNTLYSINDGKKTFIRKDGNNKELTVPEVISEIRRRDNIVLEQKRIPIDLLLDDIDDIKPLLYWINRTVPSKEAKTYFSALQFLFCGRSFLFEDIDEKLLIGARYFFTAISTIHKNEYYYHSRAKNAYGDFVSYLEKFRKSFIIFPLDIEDAVSIRIDFEHFLEEKYDILPEETQLIEFLVILLRYFESYVHPPILRNYLDISHEATTQFKKFIEIVLDKKLNAIFLPENKEPVGIKVICEKDWEFFKKEQKRLF